MSKERLLYLIIIILLILNVVLVSSMWMKNNNHLPSNGNSKELKKMFSFSDQQMAEFQVKKADHQKRIKPLLKEMSINSSMYFDMTIHSKVEKDSLLQVIQSLDKRIYKTNLRHFEDIKTICNEDQYPALDKFVKHLLNRKKGPIHK